MRKFSTYITKQDSIHCVPAGDGEVFVITPFLAVKTSREHLPTIFSKLPDALMAVGTGKPYVFRMPPFGKKFVGHELLESELGNLQPILDRLMASLDGGKGYRLGVSVGRVQSYRPYRKEGGGGELIWFNEELLNTFNLQKDEQFCIFTGEHDPAAFLREDAIIFVIPVRINSETLADLRSLWDV